MATTLTSDISRMLEAGITDVFTANFDTFPREHPGFTTAKMADKETMKYDSMGNIGAAEIKTENGTINYRKITEAYQTTVKMKTVTNGISFSIEAQNYDLYKTVSEARAKELARTMADFEEERAVRWVNNATSAAYALADGQPLATNSRPLKNTPGVFNDTYATASTLTDPDNHKTMIKMFADFKTHANTPMKSYPTNGLTHRYNMADIEEIYYSDKKANEFSNTKNVLPGIMWSYSTYMTDTDAWSMWDNRFEHIIFVKYKDTYTNSYEDVKDTLNFYYNAVAMYETAALPQVGFVYNDGAAV
jgi:hypothetical protein